MWKLKESAALFVNEGLSRRLRKSGHVGEWRCASERLKCRQHSPFESQRLLGDRVYCINFFTGYSYSFDYRQPFTVNFPAFQWMENLGPVPWSEYHYNLPSKSKIVCQDLPEGGPLVIFCDYNRKNDGWVDRALDFFCPNPCSNPRRLLATFLFLTIFLFWKRLSKI